MTGVADAATFQSLLSWISRFGAQKGCRWLQDQPGFNPCCLGLAVLAPSAGNGRILEHVFQSLLSWISRFGPVEGRHLFSQAICFNPCCLGLAVLAGPLWRGQPIDDVSILVVLD